MSLYNKVRSRAGNEEQKLFSFHELSTFWHETADVILNSTFGLIGTQKQFSQVHLFDLSKSHHTPEKQAKEQKKISHAALKSFGAKFTRQLRKVDAYYDKKKMN